MVHLLLVDINLIFGLPAYHMAVVHLVITLGIALGIIGYWYVFSGKRIRGIAVILLFSVVPIVSIFRTGDYNGGLYQNAAFATGFYDSLTEGNLIPRWAERLDTHFGYPAYIFMYSMPYYFTSFFHLLGFNFINSVKLTFAMAYVIAGIGMWVWLRHRFSPAAAGLATILYQFAPYRFIDMHFRLDIGEAVAFMWMPLVLLFVERHQAKPKCKFIVGGAISTTALILSHPAFSLVTVGVALGYALWLSQKQKFSGVINATQPILWGLALSAFYWVPFIYESRWVSSEVFASTVTLLNFRELLYSPWRWGFLFLGNHAETAYVVGYAAWAVVLLGVWRVGHKPLNKDLLFWLVTFGMVIVMMLPLSAPVWRLPLLKNFQFSYRLLGIAALISGLIAAWTIEDIRKEFRPYLAGVLGLIAILTTVMNWGNREASPLSMTDQYIREIMPIEARKQQAGYYYAIPVSVDLKNQWGDEIVSGPIETLTGKANIEQIVRTSTRHSYKVVAQTPVRIKENTFYYPGWVLTVNGVSNPIEYQDSLYPGVMEFDLAPGHHIVELQFSSTPDRTISLLLSGLTGLFLLSLITSDWIKNSSRRLSGK